MKTKKQLIQAITDSKEFKKIKFEHYYTVESFISDAKRYIKAIEEGRMICVIESVSHSGMSRIIRFLAPEKNKYNEGRFQYCQFNQFFSTLGYTSAGRRSDSFRIVGCGMDMVFHTNYTIIRNLQSIGFITKDECRKLEQMTPQVI